MKLTVKKEVTAYWRKKVVNDYTNILGWTLEIGDYVATVTESKQFISFIIYYGDKGERLPLANGQLDVVSNMSNGEVMRLCETLIQRAAEDE